MNKFLHEIESILRTIKVLYSFFFYIYGSYVIFRTIQSLSDKLN